MKHLVNISDLGSRFEPGTSQTKRIGKHSIATFGNKALYIQNEN
jgi:hypothetical protein